MSSTSREEICGSVQSFLTRPRSLRLRSRSTSYGKGLSACSFGQIKTIRKNCKVCHTSCWHAAAEKRYSPTSNLDLFPTFYGRGMLCGHLCGRHRELDPHSRCPSAPRLSSESNPLSS